MAKMDFHIFIWIAMLFEICTFNTHVYKMSVYRPACTSGWRFHWQIKFRVCEILDFNVKYTHVKIMSRKLYLLTELSSKESK